MYDGIFDADRQHDMRECFLELSNKGVYKDLKKNTVIELPSNDLIGIVIEGKIKQIISNANGVQKSLFILQPGEIFGEMDYFGGGRAPVIQRAITHCIISIVSRYSMEKEIERNPQVYRYFMHSIVRKFRIVMLQMGDMMFSDALTRIVNMILRLYIQQGKEIDNYGIIDMPFTHQQLAELIGCSRVTVTRGINYLRDKGIVDVKQKKIIIKDMDALKKYMEY